MAEPTFEASGSPDSPPRSSLKAALDRHRPVLLAGLGPALVALGLCFYVSHLPNVLYGVHEYDDGAYMGAALKFVNGIMPYRDFVIVHPPGIVVLMAPVAALSRFIGSDSSLALARDVTALVASANVMLAALAVRHRGKWAALATATALACFPMAPAADSTLLLEPYLIFFCLIGLVLMFSGGRLASRRRLVLAGIAIGLGGSVKIWGGLVAIALGLICIRRIKAALLPFALGCISGLVAVCGPFFAMAPGSFAHDVIADQFQRVASGSAALSWSQRVWVVSGLPALTVATVPVLLAVGGVFVFLVVTIAAFVRRRSQIVPADTAALTCTAAAGLALWVPNDIYTHYVYFPAAFAAVLAGTVMSLLLAGPTPDSTVRVMTKKRIAGLSAVLVALVIFSIPQQAGYARSNLSIARSAAILNLFIPPQACIVSDDAVVPIAADLFEGAPRGCPNLVDAFGTWLAEGPKHEPPTASIGRTPFSGPYNGPFPAAFENQWARWLGEADWVVQVAKTSSYIPWTPQLRAWFAGDFHLAMQSSGLWIYKHVRHTPPPQVA